MNNKLLVYGALGVALIALILSLGLLSPKLPKLGATCSGITTSAGCTAFGDVRLGDVTASTTSEFTDNASTSITIGGGTAIVKEVCGTLTKTFGTVAVGATTSVDVSVAGATSSKNQVYSFGMATTSANVLSYFASPSSTGIVSVIIDSLGAGWNVTTSTLSVCYSQF